MPTGIYNHKPRTEETKNKIRLAHLGMKNSPEARKKISLALTGKKQSQETINKRRVKLIGNKSRTGDHRSKEEIEKMNKTFERKGNRYIPIGYHPKSEFKKGCSSWNVGLTKKTDSRLAALSVKRKGCSPSPRAGRGKKGYREDLGHFVRSTWEANVARTLNILGVPYKYENKRFDLGDTTYCPDFLCFSGTEHEYFIEVKGYKDQKWIEKELKFRKLYPDIKLSIIGEKEYKGFRIWW